MPKLRQQKRALVPTGGDIRLAHLLVALLVAGCVLSATIGLPALPRLVAPSLSGVAPGGVPSSGALDHVLEQLGLVWLSITSLSMPSVPNLVDVELFLRSPSNEQLDAVGILLSWVAWLLWVWLLGTITLRILVIFGERAGIGATWIRRLRTVSDRITLSLVRQAVDAALAGELFLSAVAPAPSAFAQPSIHYAQVQRTDAVDARGSVVGGSIDGAAMDRELMAGDMLYTVQRGDTLSAIAERFYGDPSAFNRIVEANLDREQPTGRTLKDARFIYPGWQLVVPQPTQGVYTDPDGQPWYTVRRGDTLSGISAELLGGAERYPELFAMNEGIALGDGHVLTNPNLIWPGLHLRLPSHTSPDDTSPAEATEPSQPEDPQRRETTSDAARSVTPEPTDPEANEPIRPSTTDRDNASEAPFGSVEPTPMESPGDERPAHAVPGEGSPSQWPTLALPGDAKTDLLVSGGLGVAAILAFRATRKRTRPEPESDTRLDVHAFTLAEPAAVAARR